MHIHINFHPNTLIALKNNKKNGTKIIIPIILKIKSLSWLPVLYINSLMPMKQKTIDNINNKYSDIQRLF